MYNSIRIALLFALCTSVFAADRYYVGPANGVWSDPNNWSATAGGAGGAGVPQPGDQVFVQPSAATTLAINTNYSSELGPLSMSGSAAALTLNQNTNVNVLGGLANISSVTYNHSAGGFSARGSTLSGTVAHPMTYNLSGTATLSNISLLPEIHITGAGMSMFQSGGTVQSSSTLNVENSAVYHLDGGSVHVEDLYLDGAQFFQNGGNMGPAFSLQVFNN